MQRFLGAHMTISLQQDIAKYIEAKMKSGEYASADEVVHALLVEARDREVLDAGEIAALGEN